MKSIRYDDVRDFLQHFLSVRLEEQGRALPDDLTDEYDLLLSGLLDSLGLLEMVAAIQQRFGSGIDFESLDPEKLSMVGPLCHFVAGTSHAKNGVDDGSFMESRR